jgi:3-dehydroquinate dehydratase-2
MKTKLLVMHGPNLNLLGTREVEIYGKLTLPALNRRLAVFARQNGATLRFFQSNSEGALIDFLHRQRRWAQGLVINPAAYTHYSYALRDAIAAVELPAVEVHLSDIRKREPFRRKSVIRPVCLKQISGLGWKSYCEGIRFLARHSRG